LHFDEVKLKPVFLKIMSFKKRVFHKKSGLGKPEVSLIKKRI